MTPLPFEAERDAPISTLWTPHNGTVCYPAVEAAQPLGVVLAREVVALWAHTTVCSDGVYERTDAGWTKIR